MSTDPSSGSIDPPPSWKCRIALWFVVFVGLCELAATTSWLDLSWAPSWLAGTVIIVGYLAFLVLFGFTSLVGNVVVGVMVLALLWRGWGWPFWRAALVASPFWIVFCRIIPTPW